MDITLTLWNNHSYFARMMPNRKWSNPRNMHHDRWSSTIHNNLLYTYIIRSNETAQRLTYFKTTIDRSRRRADWRKRERHRTNNFKTRVMCTCVHVVCVRDANNFIQTWAQGKGHFIHIQRKDGGSGCGPWMREAARCRVATMHSWPGGRDTLSKVPHPNAPITNRILQNYLTKTL